MRRNIHTHRPRMVAVLIAATMLPATALLAQETTPAVQPTVTAPAPAAAPAQTPSRVFAPSQAVVQPTPPRAAPPVEPAAPAEAAAPARAATRATPHRATEARSSVARSAPAPRAVAAAPIAPVVAAPAIPPAATPPAATPAPIEAAPAATAPSASGDPEALRETSVNTTPWLAIAAVIGLAALVLGFLLRRRRRSADEFEPRHDYVPTDETGTPLPEVDLAERPWIRLALQPTRAETYNGDQTVDYDLIVENEGRVTARDVRVSSFLTGVAGATASDALRAEQSQTHHIDVEPGASIPLPGTVTVRGGIDPKIVADARYKLPDGSEGHLAALFGIDTSNDEPEAQVEDVLERV